MYSKALNTSRKHDYETPDYIYGPLNDEFNFTLDPCCTHETAKTAKHYTPEENGLAQSWEGHTVFMNPPYGGATSKWMAKALVESRKGATVVCLVVSRTSTAWWHDYAMQGEIRFIRGCIKFVGAKYNAPFPSALVIFRPKQQT